MAKNEYPTIISFYTDSWEYPQYAKELIRNCRGLGLEYYIIEKESTGNWLKNTTLKPLFILEALETVQRPVLWIDVDGSILHRPELLKSGYPYDFAARKMPPGRARTWHVGTMYFAYTPQTLEFLREWVRRISGLNGSDESALDVMWKDGSEHMHNLSMGELPKEYFEMLRQLKHIPSTGTIICHRASKDETKMQMKRRHKGRLELAKTN